MTPPRSGPPGAAASHLGRRRTCETPLYTVTVDCTACGACLRTCPERSIRPAAPCSPAPLVVLDSCSGCGECAEICPVEACVEVTRS